ncbi:hypothetical protein [Geodermatophilus sp. URMC 64]
MDRPDLDSRRGDAAPPDRRRRWLAAGAAVGAGLLTGAVAAGVLGDARAATTETAAATHPATVTDPVRWWPHWSPGGDPCPSGTADAVPSDTAARVRSAVSAGYPGATVGWVRPDGAGGYVAYGHTADGAHVAWHLDGSFAVTGTDDLPQPDPDWPDGGLSADTAARVRSAVQARYPGAVVWRVQADGSGGYVAYADTDGRGTAGDDVVVHLNASFAVTGTDDLPGC